MSIIKAYIVPHPPLAVPEVGRGKEKTIQNTLDNYQRIAQEIKTLKPDTIVLSSPHAPSYRDYFHITDTDTLRGDLAMFGAPQVQLNTPCDRTFIQALEQKASEATFKAGTKGARGATLDHGSMVPLYYIMHEYDDFSLVRVSPSGLSNDDHYTMGTLIKKTADALDRKVVYVASGDLSHKLTHEGPYGYHESGPAFDKTLTSLMQKKDLRGFLSIDQRLSHEAAQCGLGSFIMMAGAIGGKSEDSELMSYEGPFGVGYAIARYTPKQTDTQETPNPDESKDRPDPYVALARKTLEEYFKVDSTSQPRSLPSSMKSEKAGAFVTLKKNGKLRGCIGTLEPTQPSIAEEIRRNAVAAAVHDPRFPPLTKEELKDLSISVDVLGQAEKVESQSELDPKTYGVIVELPPRKGVLLPDLEGIDTPDKQLSIALRKANIHPKEAYDVKRFKVHRHHE
ncbi:MAG: AmmeMemoRadiSam system protein A [Bacillota bacterium]